MWSLASGQHLQKGLNYVKEVLASSQHLQKDAAPWERCSTVWKEVLMSSQCLQKVVELCGGGLCYMEAEVLIPSWHKCLEGDVVFFCGVVLSTSHQQKEAMSLLQNVKAWAKHRRPGDQVLVAQAHNIVQEVKPFPQLVLVWNKESHHYNEGVLPTSYITTWMA